MSTIDQIGAVWAKVARETPDPWLDDSPLFAHLTGAKPLSYRERLDRPRRNAYGEVIPQIALVRANIRRLGKPTKPPRIPA